MADFTVILQDPNIRALVQDGILERAFHDALFPRLLYRGEAAPVIFPGNVGDSMFFTGTGLIPPNGQPIVPGQDPIPQTYTEEQWNAIVQQYAQTIDTHMPTSIVAIANLFLRNAQQLGLAAGQTLNRIVRNRMFNAALSGNTVASASGAATTSLPVVRLNGFTRSRRPDLALGSPVQFSVVTGNNPLPINIIHAGVPLSVNVIGFSSTNPGDEVGPGTLTLDVAQTFSSRDPVISNDASVLVRVGGGNSIDSINAGSLLTMQAVRSAVSRMRQENVPEHTDGAFHCHLDPTSESEIFADPEWQRLHTSLPDYFMYKQFGIGYILGVAFFRNTESPLKETVGDKSGNYILTDPFPGELLNASSVPVHRALFTGQGGIMEYYIDLALLLTEAGVTGKVGEPRISNNGIEVNTERIQLLLRSPLNRLQDLVSASWKFMGDWPIRTDATTGDAARYKRFVAIEHG
jgi:hypothetical protein